MDQLAPMETAAKDVVRCLLAHGFQAYFVGGYVRDKLLGKTSDDIDIATSARPEEVMRLFARTVPTGLKHGTVTVLAGKYPLEVTTFRREGPYTDNRHPEQIDYIDDIRLDLARRDFTINAIAMDIDGNIIDPFGGKADLEAKIVRTVGDPLARFQEDALRLLRCLRFAAAFAFTIDPDTWEALLASRPNFRQIAMERVRSELEKIVEGPHPYIGIELLAASRLTDYTKKDGGLYAAHWGQLGSLRACLDMEGLTGSLRWTAVYLLLGFAADVAERSMRAYTFAGKRIRTIADPLKVNETLAGDKPLRERFAAAVLCFGPAAAEQWLRLLQQASVLPCPGFVLPPAELLLLREQGTAWLHAMPVKALSELDIQGSDLLKAFRLKPGPWVGKVLEQLCLDAALQRVDNARGELMKRAEKYVGDARVAE